MFCRLFAASNSLSAPGKDGGDGCVLSRQVQQSLIRLEKFGEQLLSDNSNGEDGKHKQQQEATAEHKLPHWPSAAVRWRLAWI